MVSSRSEENVNLKHFQHLVVSQCWCALQFFLDTFVLVYLADVIASVFWPTLLYLTDVIAMCHIVVDVVPPGQILYTETISETLTSKPRHNHNHTHTKKWVHNLSKTPLTDEQEKVLAWGPNFAVVTQEPPIGKYLSQIERMCQQLKQGKAEEL